MIKWLAQSLYNFSADARRTSTSQLVTISYSHYNELARWSLELGGGEPFVESGFAPGQHVLPALSVRLPKTGERHFATSSSMNANAKPSATSLPVLVRPDGTVLRDSWEIAASTSLAPIDSALRDVLDYELGVAARKLAYCILLKPEHAGQFTIMCTEGRHWAWRLLWACGVGAMLRAMLAKSLQTADPVGFATCVATLDGLMAPTGPLSRALSASRAAGHEYLGGAAVGQADIALASIGALLVLPENYGGRDLPMAPHFAYLLSKDAQMRTLVDAWRRTDVGAYILRLYATVRTK